MDKSILLTRIIDNLQNEVDKLQERWQITKQAVIDAPGAMQSGSDTTKYQESRIADNIENNIIQKKQEIALLRKMLESGLMKDKKFDEVQLRSIIEIRQSNGNTSVYFLLPVSGGIKTEYENQNILVINLKAPIVKLLLGHRAGDIIKSGLSSSQNEIEILNVY